MRFEGDLIEGGRLRIERCIDYRLWGGWANTRRVLCVVGYINTSTVRDTESTFT